MAKDIRVTLEIDNQQYIAELKRSEQATQAFAKNSEAGAKNVQQGLKGLDNSAKQLTQSMNRLKAVLGIAAFTAFAASAIQMGDAISDMAKATGFSIAQLQNLRSALATNGGEAENAGNLLAQFGQKVDDLAQGNEKAIDSFARVGVSMEDVATLSEQDLFKKTVEGLAQIQNPAERSAIAMDLMGKAAKGVSFGSDFVAQMNQVSERSLAAASAIKAAGEFADQFKRSIESIKESFLIAFEPLIKGFTFLLKALPDLTVAFQVLGAVIVGLTVATGLGAFVGGIRLAIALVTRLGGAMSRIPLIGGLIAGAGTAIAQLTGVGRDTEAANQATEASQRNLQLTAEQKRMLVDINLEYDRSISKNIKKIQLDTELIGKTEQQKEKILALRNAEVEKDSIVEKLNQKRVAGNRLLNEAIDAEIAKINQRFETTKQTLEVEIALKQELLEAQRDITRNTQAEADLQQKIKDIQDRYLLETLVGIEKELKQIEIAETKIMEAAMAKWEVENQGLRTTGEYARRKEEEYQKVKAITDKSIRTQQEAARKANEQSRTFSTGWNRAFKEYVDNATNAARQAEEVFRTASRGIEDAIVRFVKTGKFEFKSLVQDILETILRSQIQQIIGSIFNIGGMGRPGGGGGGVGIGDIIGGIGGVLGGIGGAIGDVIGGIGDIFGGFFAKGGTLGAGKVGIAGESGPELITGPATVTPISGTTNVHYHINAVDARSFKQLVAADPGFIHAIAQYGAQSTPRR